MVRSGRRVDGYDRQAYTIVCDTLVNLQFVNKGTGECKVNILAVVTDVNDGSKLFNYSRKHKLIYNLTIYVLRLWGHKKEVVPMM